MVGKFVIACMLLVPVASAAQNMKVIPLSEQDAATAQNIHIQQENLDKRRADFNEHVRQKYTSHLVIMPVCAAISLGNQTPHEPAKYCGLSKEDYEKKSKYYSTSPGWENGFEYDVTFKYIVPKQYIPSPCSGNTWSWSNCGVTTPWAVPTYATSPITLTN